MTSTKLLQLVDNLQQAGKIRNLQQVCGVSGCDVSLCHMQPHQSKARFTLYRIAFRNGAKKHLSDTKYTLTFRS
jgi:hypothetical protein